MRLPIALLLVAIVCSPHKALFADDNAKATTPTHKWVVVFDLVEDDKRANEEGKLGANRVISCEASVSNNHRISGAPPKKDTLSSADADIIHNALKDSSQLPALLDGCDDRWISSRGDILLIRVLRRDTDKAKVGTDEKTRKSQIATDLSTLAKVIAKVAGADAAISTTLVIDEHIYALGKERSTLTVTANLEPISSLAAKAETPKPLTTDIITGPREHWFLSTDLPVNSVNQLKFDEDTHEITPKKEPSRFYIGINFMLGDLFKNYLQCGKDAENHFHCNSDIWRGLVIKGMILTNKQPLDSYGFALAYRRKPGTFSPFVGWTFTKEDSQGSNGSVKKDSKRNSQFRAGLSLNLDQALTWLKAGSS
jgi:hypothetical protein